MNTKIVLAVVALVVVGLFGWFFYLQPGAFPLPQEGQENAGPVAAEDAEFSEAGEYYTISVAYPALPAVERAVMETVAQFKEDGNFENLTPQDIEIQGLGGERKYALDITYKAYTSNNLASFVLTIYSDTLGAHPNVFFRTFTFDETGAEVRLGDLFDPGASYLQRISQKVYTGVLAQLEERGGTVSADMEDTVRIGTSPTPETLQFFYLDGNTLHILIPPYQAAAYAAGSFDVAIPLSELQDILR